MHHIIKMVISVAAHPAGQVGQWGMAHLKGLTPHMNTLCGLPRLSEVTQKRGVDRELAF